MDETNNSGKVNMNPTEYTIHAMRKEIDGMIQKVTEFAHGHEYQGTVEEPANPRIICESAQEFQHAIKALREAKMWLGETLKVHGSPLPPQYADNAERGSGNEEAE